MGLFDKVFGKAEDEKLNQAEGFAGLAVCAVAADGVITEEEVLALSTSLMNRKLYQGLSNKQMQAIFNKLSNIAKSQGVEVLMQKSAAAIPDELKATTFAVATDLLLADGVMAESEKKFLEKVQKALGINDETALKIADVISIKNKG